MYSHWFVDHPSMFLVTKGWCILYGSLLTSEWIRYYILAILFYCADGSIMVWFYSSLSFRSSILNKLALFSIIFSAFYCMPLLLSNFFKLIIVSFPRLFINRRIVQNTYAHGTNLSRWTRSIQASNVIVLFRGYS